MSEDGEDGTAVVDDVLLSDVVVPFPLAGC